MEKIQIISKIIFSFSLAYFATALILFTLEISNTRKEIPVLLDKVEAMENNSNITKIITLANDVTIQVKELKKEIPNILTEVEEIRKVIPNILKQVEAINKNIPSVLEEVKQTRKTLPSILKESEQIREAIPPILKESKELRADLPEILRRTENITNNMENIATDAGSGAIKGTIKGIFTLPGDIIRGTAEKVVGEDNDENREKKE